MVDVSIISKEMDILKVYFQMNEKPSLIDISKFTQISYSRTLSFYSLFLSSQTNLPKQNPQVCPTCGKLKNAVTSFLECRDVFHYL